MPRRPRGRIVDSFLHITAKGNRGAPIYWYDQDYRFFLSCLERCAAQHAVRVHAYCLMTNHFHLLVEVGAVPVSKVMQTLLQRYAQYTNRVHSSHGHLFTDRFWARLCQRDAYLLELLRYVHLNPMRARLAATPELYPWSTHRAYLGVTNVPWIATTSLDLFSPDRERAIAAYARFVRAGIPGQQI